MADPFGAPGGSAPAPTASPFGGGSATPPPPPSTDPFASVVSDEGDASPFGGGAPASAEAQTTDPFAKAAPPPPPADDSFGAPPAPGADPFGAASAPTADPFAAAVAEPDGSQGMLADELFSGAAAQPGPPAVPADDGFDVDGMDGAGFGDIGVEDTSPKGALDVDRAEEEEGDPFGDLPHSETAQATQLHTVP